MPDYTATFEVLGAFARAFTTLDNFSRRNLKLTDSGDTIRSLDRLRQDFVDVLNDSGPERDTLAGVTVLSSAAEATRGWAAALEQTLDQWIRGALGTELNVAGATRDDILHALVRAMHADDESVAPNAVALTEISADANNAGNPALVAGIDTVTPDEQVIDDERVRTQRVSIQCTRDAVRHRLPVGQEEFRVQPEHGAALNLRMLPVNAGDHADPRNAIVDGAFASWDGGAPAHWSIEAGASIVSEEDTEILFGESALNLAGDGATAADLRQDLAERSPPLQAGAFYALGAWVHVVTHNMGNVMMDLLIDGDPSALTLTVDGSTPTAEWVHLGGIEYLPRDSFPNKVIARVRCSSDFDGEVLVDGVSLGRAHEVAHAGLRLVLMQGPAVPQAGDRFAIDTSSDDVGAFQSFARDRLGVALPSDDSPSISDNLAE
jgi:hypothetical protein